MMIRARAGLVRTRTGLVNTARGLAKNYGAATAWVQRAEYESGESRASESGTASGTSTSLLAAIESVSEQIAEYNERIEKLAQESYPQVALLKRQIKGVGTLIALTFLLTLEDPHRFRKSRDVGLLSGAAAGAQKLGTERAAAA